MRRVETYFLHKGPLVLNTQINNYIDINTQIQIHKYRNTELTNDLKLAVCRENL